MNRLVRRVAGATLWALMAAGAQAQGEEVPFVVTPDHVTREMLRLAAVTPSDVVLDLGSGDGRIVIAAARQFGARGLGVEIVPELVEKSRAHARQAGVADRVEFRVQDLFATDLAQATVITMYLLPEVNLQLRPKLLALKPGTRIVSHDWDMGDWPADRVVSVDVPDKPIGREKRSRLHLWIVPARVEGYWCHRALRLWLTQVYQTVHLNFGAALMSTSGRLDGATLAAGGTPTLGSSRADTGAGAAVVLELAADGNLQVSRARGPWESLAGATFRRAPASSFPTGPVCDS